MWELGVPFFSFDFWATRSLSGVGTLLLFSFFFLKSGLRWEVRSSRSTPRWSTLFGVTEPPDPGPLRFWRRTRRCADDAKNARVLKGGRARFVGGRWSAEDQTLPWRVGQSPLCSTGSAVHDGLVAPVCQPPMLNFVT